MNILYLPIDERPCNTTVVNAIAGTSQDVTLKIPPMSFLGRKKTPAKIQELWKWIDKEIENCEGLIFSPELMLYGGLIPSRLHHLEEENRQGMLKKLARLKEKYPLLTIVSSTIVMRTPQYSSSDEEPDYYGEFGESIFLSKYLFDKKERIGLTEDETRTLEDLSGSIPETAISDFEKRRAYNLETTFSLLNFLESSVLDYIVVPQDDSAEFGYTAIDQKKVFEYVNEKKLRRKTSVHPGSDEVGATLLARLVNVLNEHQPKIYPVYSSTLGPSLIPNYEDRPFNETLKKHIIALNGKLVYSLEEADIVLGYNTPGKIMQESWVQEKTVDQTYYSFRDLQTFTEVLKEAVESGKKVSVADSAYSNGGDRELLDHLIQENLFLNLHSYKGWNTNANTLGTTLAQGCLAVGGSEQTIKANIYHLLDDYIYQAVVRSDITDTLLNREQLTYNDLKDKSEVVNESISADILKVYQSRFPELAEVIHVENLVTKSPWNRMFETRLTFDLHF